MPTESGLRLFVDGMMQVAEPSAEDRAQIEASLSDAGPIESALAQATFRWKPPGLATRALKSWKSSNTRSMASRMRR